MSFRDFLNSGVSLVFLLISTSISLAGPSKTIRDWSVYCSDTLNCSLATIPQSDVLYSFEFQRGPEGNAPVTLRLSLSGKLTQRGAVSIFIPSVLDVFSIQASSGVERDGYVFFTDPRYVTDLIPAFLKGKQAVVVFNTEKGKQQAVLSLSGSSAAALFMDEVQDRIEKTDALVAKGPNPPTGVQTQAKELNSIADLPEEVARKWRNHPDECAGYNDEDLIARFGGISIKLEDQPSGAIYVIPCGGPGAYNLVYAGFLYNAETRRATTLMFPTMSAKGPTVVNTIINMSWDDRRGELSAYYKGRGLGDCGVASKWMWDGAGVYGNFILIEERSKDDCDGKDDEWPLVWPVQ